MNSRKSYSLTERKWQIFLTLAIEGEKSIYDLAKTIAFYTEENWRSVRVIIYRALSDLIRKGLIEERISDNKRILRLKAIGLALLCYFLNEPWDDVISVLALNKQVKGLDLVLFFKEASRGIGTEFIDFTEGHLNALKLVYAPTLLPHIVDFGRVYGDLIDKFTDKKEKEIMKIILKLQSNLMRSSLLADSLLNKLFLEKISVLPRDLKVGREVFILLTKTQENFVPRNMRLIEIMAERRNGSIHIEFKLNKKYMYKNIKELFLDESLYTIIESKKLSRDLQKSRIAEAEATKMVVSRIIAGCNYSCLESLLEHFHKLSPLIQRALVKRLEELISFHIDVPYLSGFFYTLEIYHKYIFKRYPHLIGIDSKKLYELLDKIKKSTKMIEEISKFLKLRKL